MNKYWRIYGTSERGWIALSFLILSLFLLALFGYPTFRYREQTNQENLLFLNCHRIPTDKLSPRPNPNSTAESSSTSAQPASTCNIFDLQLAFKADRFKTILQQWDDLPAFRRSLWQIDLLFPLAYAGLLAFGYAWGRHNKQPSRWDRVCFIMPFGAALCDWVENIIHLQLLRQIDNKATLQATSFSEALVFTASFFAALKICLIAASAVILLIVVLIYLKRHLRRLPSILPYIYVLRFPAITALALVGFAYIAFLTDARSLLENLFDLSTWGVFWVSLVAFLIAWAVMATLRLLLLYGPRRFKILPFKITKRMSWSYFARHGLLALPVTVGAVLKSGEYAWLGVGGALMLAALGLFASLLVLWMAMFLHRFLTVPDAAIASAPEQDYADLLLPSPRPGQAILDAAYKFNPFPHWSWRLLDKLNGVFSRLGPGYVDRNGRIIKDHLLAVALLLTSVFIYAFVGISKYLYLGDESGIPALSYILWLLLLFCWGFSAFSFLLDRYRLPVLIPVLVLLMITAQFPQSDHYYHLLDRTTPPQVGEGLRASVPLNQPLSPGDVVQAKPEGSVRTDDQSTLIVVAASGGGIQAAAWAAQVLTGLEQDNAGKFGPQIRLISAVSGGSVGVMYFVDAYRNRDDGTLDEVKLSKVVQRSMRSSINALAWGLVYPDFLRTLCPLCIGSMDRGQALETAWLQEELPAESDSLSEATLSRWREDALQKRRPAVIFNTTITDTGQRLLLATSAPNLNLPESSIIGAGGSRSFAELYPKHDLKIVTATRLSATFPYVSPAARADLKGPQYHIVDGGYYDNYGISSLTQWLDEAITPNTNVKRVLIVQIRAFPGEDGDGKMQRGPRISRGWFYQAFAPVSTLLNVRTAGQSAHNQIELNLLRETLRNRCLQIDIANFEFRGAEKLTKCKDSENNYNPPLSWHLTPKQRDEITAEWRRLEGCNDRETVKRFLNPERPQKNNSEIPLKDVSCNSAK
jgi:hypothetical protein